MLQKSLKLLSFPQKSTKNRFFTNAISFNKVSEALEKWKGRFEQEDIAEPFESILNILAFNLGTKNFAHVNRLKSETLTLEQIKNVEKMCEQRLKRVPLQYIIGEWDFRQLTLKMKPPVFIPRPETEMLVDLVLREVDEKNVKHVLELCCGSGAIALSLLFERPELRVTAIDQSEEACVLTKENAQRYQLCKRLCVVRSKVREGNAPFLHEKLDLIVSNPPYVPSADMKNLQPEILQYEDLAALDGGETGLNVIKLILNSSSGTLLAGGKLFLEVDPSHPEMIRKWLAGNEAKLGLGVVGVFRDFLGRERFVAVEKTTVVK